MSKHSHAMSTEAQASKEFLHIRIKFTAVVVFIAAIVLGTFLALGAVGEYNKQMDFVKTTLESALDDTVEQSEGVDEMIEESVVAVEHAPQTIGIGSDYISYSYVPIAVYKADYGEGILLPVNVESGIVSETAMQEGTPFFLAFDNGYYHADSESLVCVKKTTPEGDLLAFTDASIVLIAVQNYVRTVGSALLVGLFVLMLIIWTLTSWMVRPLREIWERQRVFIGNASHELKTPLTTIKANLELVSDDKIKGKEERKAAIAQALAETDRMVTLVRDLLDIATEKAYSAPKAGFDFSKVVIRQSLLFEAKALERGIMIDSEGIEGGIEAYANEDNVSTLVGILMDNACKYAYDGTQIDVTLSRDRKYAELRVANEGPEIEEGMRSEIFNRFVRADEARTGHANESSYGLGLAMARDIATASNGEISTFMIGSKIVFSVRIPLAK